MFSIVSDYGSMAEMKGIDWEKIYQQVRNYDNNRKILKQIEVDVENPNSEYNQYARRKRLIAFYAFLKSVEYKTDEIKQLSIVLEGILLDKYRHVADVIREDMQELDLCFSVGAYKATLILAGSILEAFLLDWLSEKDGKDYFYEPFLVEMEDGKGGFRLVNKDNLFWYIKKIEEIEQPDWMEPENKADYIREKRNTVHVKLCLKKDIEINREICQKVIQYLTDIVRIRFEKWGNELRFQDSMLSFVVDL